MDTAALLAASRRERALYEELGAVYRDLARALAADAVPTDPAWMAAQSARAEATTHELREVGALLGAVRLTGDPVAAEVRDLWRASAALAAQVAEANARITELAAARRAEVAAALGRLREGRRALAGYRPADAGRTAAAGRRA